MAGGAQAKMSTWFSKPNESLISKVTKKRVGFNLKIFVFGFWRASTFPPHAITVKFNSLSD